MRLDFELVGNIKTNFIGTLVTYAKLNITKTRAKVHDLAIERIYKLISNRY